MKLDRFLYRTGDFFTTFFFGDPGLGSLYGGFGIIFWGIGFPSFIYILISTMRQITRVKNPKPSEIIRGDEIWREKVWFPLFFWGNLIAGLLFLYVYSGSIDLLSRSPRLVLYIPALGLVAYALVIPHLSKGLPGINNFLKVLCIFGALLNLVQLGAYKHPMYFLKAPLSDQISGLKPSPYKYYFYLGPVLALLDELTSINPGLSVYVAGPSTLSWTAPFFGTKLQNRVWNFDPKPFSDPDAFIFHKDKFGSPLLYLGLRITPEEVTLDPRYSLITRDQGALFYLKNTVLEHPKIREELAIYYKRISRPIIPLARELSNRMVPESIILISSPLAYSFLYLKMNQEISQKIVFVPKGYENQASQLHKDRLIYSFGQPLMGFRGKFVFDFPLGDIEEEVFENRRFE